MGSFKDLHVKGREIAESEHPLLSSTIGSTEVERCGQEAFQKYLSLVEEELFGVDCCFPVYGDNEGANPEIFPEAISSCAAVVDDLASSIVVSLANEETLDEAEEEQDCDIFIAYIDDSDDEVDPTGNIAAAPLAQQLILEEARMICLTIVGQPFWEKMEGAGFPILPQLLSSVGKKLDKLKVDSLPIQFKFGEHDRIYYDKGVAVPLRAFRKEACKWIYPFMRSHQQKVAAHPKFIKNIPRNWSRKHQDPYPCVKDCQQIAKAFGLDQKQMRVLFENARKRALGKDPDLNARLKRHFSPSTRNILRTWQSTNPGQQPDAQSRQDLMEKTGLTKGQIIDWFNNHKEQRNRSNKKVKGCTENIA